MYEGGIFNNIAGENIDKVKDIFENKIEITSKLKNKSLMEMNKIVMTEIINDLSILKKENYNIENVNKEMYKSKNETLKERNKDFNERLNMLQDDFNNLNKSVVPEGIDFSDNNNDTPLKTNEIDILLSETIKKRQNELNIVLEKQNKQDAEKWINETNTSSYEKNKLLLGEEVKEGVMVEDVKQSNNKKNNTKVRFNDNDEIINTKEANYENKRTYGEDLKNNFFNILKKKENTMNKIDENLNNNLNSNELKKEIIKLREDVMDIKILLRSLSLNIERLVIN